MVSKKQLRAAAAAVAVALGITLTAGLGVLDAQDLALSDALYQIWLGGGDEIVLVGIDQESLDLLGPFPWGRDVSAMLLDTLNASEEERPAAIALDILYTGETDPDADLWLAESAGQYGNVIAACAGIYGDALIEDGAGDYLLAPSSVVTFDQPYEALASSAVLGHINTMMDGDGILRHHLLEITLPDGRQVPSMALAAAEMYRTFRGEGPVVRPETDPRGFWYLPYTGTPGSVFQYISAADLLTSDGFTGIFGGKIVLIGPYAPGLQDSYFTSADHAQSMYGMEYQANAIASLLRQDGKREAGQQLQLALLFALSLLCAALFWRRKVAPATLCWAGVCGGWILFCKGLYQAGWVLHVLWVPLAATVLYIVCLAVNYIQAAMERREVTNRFKHYVAPEIVNEILKEGKQALALGGKRTNIAVLFVDVRGFTSMSERLADEPERVVEILNRYLSLIADCILKNGGTLDKFVGDAAMAFWGAPLPKEDYVMHAARAAMDMVEGSQLLAEELERDFGQSVSFGIGIHLGDAVVGNMGSTQRMDYTAIGDTVNTAARLEANAPGGTIYISRAVADALRGRISVSPLEAPIHLKGKKEGFEVLTLDRILET